MADQQFAFMSAAEEPPREKPVLTKQKGKDEMEARMQSLESSMMAIQGSLAKLVDAPAPTVPVRKPAMKKPTPHTTFAARPIVIEAETPQITGLDPTVVKSALQAGIPIMGQLKSLGGLLLKSNKMHDLPGRAPRRRDDVLGETDEEAEVPDDYEPDLLPEDEQPATPIEAAVLQLTKIVGGMTKHQRSGKDLAALLDGRVSNELLGREVEGCRLQEASSKFDRQSFCHLRSCGATDGARLKLCRQELGSNTGQKCWTTHRASGQFGRSLASTTASRWGPTKRHEPEPLLRSQPGIRVHWMLARG